MNTNTFQKTLRQIFDGTLTFNPDQPNPEDLRGSGLVMVAALNPREPIFALAHYRQRILARIEGEGKLHSQAHDNDTANPADCERFWTRSQVFGKRVDALDNLLRVYLPSRVPELFNFGKGTKHGVMGNMIVATKSDTPPRGILNSAFAMDFHALINRIFAGEEVFPVEGPTQEVPEFCSVLGIVKSPLARQLLSFATLIRRLVVDLEYVFEVKEMFESLLPGTRSLPDSQVMKNAEREMRFLKKALASVLNLGLLVAADATLGHKALSYPEVGIGKDWVLFDATLLHEDDPRVDSLVNAVPRPQERIDGIVGTLMDILTQQDKPHSRVPAEKV